MFTHIHIHTTYLQDELVVKNPRCKSIYINTCFMQIHLLHTHTYTQDTPEGQTGRQVCVPTHNCAHTRTFSHTLTFTHHTSCRTTRALRHVCKCIDIRKRKHIYTHMHTCSHAHTYTHYSPVGRARRCIWKLSYLQISIQLQAYTHMFTDHTYTKHTSVGRAGHWVMYVYICTYTSIFTHILTHVHTHIHTPNTHPEGTHTCSHTHTFTQHTPCGRTGRCVIYAIIITFVNVLTRIRKGIHTHIYTHNTQLQVELDVDWCMWIYISWVNMYTFLCTHVHAHIHANNTHP